MLRIAHASRQGVTFVGSNLDYAEFLSAIQRHRKSRKQTTTLNVERGSVIPRIILQKVPRLLKVELQTGRRKAIVISGNTEAFGLLSGIVWSQSESGRRPPITITYERVNHFLEQDSLQMTLSFK